MRVTVSLDDNVTVALQAMAEQRGVSFTAALNAVVRAGLADATQQRDHTVPSLSLGLRPGIDLDRALTIATNIEDDETLRKLAIGR